MARREKLKALTKLILDPTHLNIERDIQRWERLLLCADEKGQTILHKAIDARLSPAKINVLLSNVNGLAEICLEQKLPLELALDGILETTDDAATLLLVFKAYPEAVKKPDAAGVFPLHKLFSMRSWLPTFDHVAFAFLEAYPSACQYMVDGMLPLHLALRKRVSSSIIHKLLDCYPSSASASQGSLTDVQKLPIHICIKNNCTHDVGQRLLVLYPSALIMPVKVGGSTTSLLEFGMKCQAEHQLLEAMMAGVNLNDPKSVVLTSASLSGFILRQSDASIRRETQRGSRERVTTSSTFLPQAPSHTVTFLYAAATNTREEMRLPLESTFSDLENQVAIMEKVPMGSFYLTFDGKRMIGKNMISSCIKSRNDVIVFNHANLLLHTALNCGVERKTISTLVDLREDLAFVQDGYGKFPLHIVLQDNRYPELCIKFLGLYPDAALVLPDGPFAAFPLEQALQNGLPEDVCMALLENFGSQDITPEGYFAPHGQVRYQHEHARAPLLFLAVRNGCSRGVISKLLVKKAPIMCREASTALSPVECALLSSCDGEIFGDMLRAAAYVNPHVAVERGQGGCTLLHLACLHRVASSRIMKLLEFGNHALMLHDLCGRLPIHIAVMKGVQFDVVRAMVDRCPESLREPDGRGQTPLEVALTHNPGPGVIFELARCAENPEAIRDARGRSLLQIAVASGAPVFTVQELVLVAPSLIERVNFFEGQWPINPAAVEVKRLALQRTRKKKIPTEATLTSARASAVVPATPKSRDISAAEHTDANWPIFEYLFGSSFF
eukprot:TRINITY_DN73807_c0_g1_i1.p1 TRINITY_DN73807_c0_g1~~TRINITY_DN73807_c0_g1_i1.p1  ORF type:complete len:784 (-),score=92.65 TRINITY_DN73807_c0_g1_i1:78-2429(-)